MGIVEIQPTRRLPWKQGMYRIFSTPYTLIIVGWIHEIYKKNVIMSHTILEIYYL